MTRDAGPTRPVLEIGLLLAIFLVALFLRIQNLGELGLWIDEDLTWIASQGILDHGYPLMPSGEIYSRGLPYSYVIAGARALFGDTEAVLRAPSVVFSLLTLLLAFRIGKHLGGRWTGLLAAVVLAVSPWEWHYAQMARMYSLFALLFLLGIWWMVRGLFHGSRACLWGAVALVPPTVLTHQLGAALALSYLVPWIFPRATRPHPAWSLAGVVAVGLSMGMRNWFLPREGLTLVHRGYTGGALSIPVLPPLDLNHSQLLLHRIAGESTTAMASIAILLLVGSALFLRWAWRSGGRGIPLLGCAAMCVAVFANQMVVAGVVLVILVKVQARSPRDAARWLLGGVAWLVVGSVVFLGGAAIVEGADVLTERRFMRLFVSLPSPYYRLLFEQFPLMFSTVLAGSVWIYLRSFREGESQERVFLVFAFLGPLFLMGFFLAPFTGHRYNYYLNPIFTILFAYIVSVGVRHLVETRGWTGSVRAGAAAALTAGALIILCEQFDPGQTWAATRRGYGYNEDTIEDPDLNASFHYDYKGCAQFVAEAREPGDLIVSINATEVYPYGVRADYRISDLSGIYALGNGEVVDWYTGIPILSDAGELAQQVASHRGGSVWIIYTEEHEEGPVIHLSEDVQAYLLEQRDARVYQGRDVFSFVLKIDPS